MVSYSPAGTTPRDRFGPCFCFRFVRRKYRARCGLHIGTIATHALYRHVRFVPKAASSAALNGLVIGAPIPQDIGACSIMSGLRPVRVSPHCHASVWLPASTGSVGGPLSRCNRCAARHHGDLRVSWPFSLRSIRGPGRVATPAEGSPSHRCSE